MVDFFRFPSTPHLVWLGESKPRDDKVLSAEEARSLLKREVVVEEKLDGANLGFSTSDEGDLRLQNRGSYLDPAQSHQQFRVLRSWLAARESALTNALWPNLVLFGEWCFAVHSVFYDQLPDWFLGFDVYDRDTGRFWDTGRRDSLLSDIGLHAVPRLAEGRFSINQVTGFLSEPSQFGGETVEGVVVRHESGGSTTIRAKLVRAEFAQAINKHWSKRPLRRNKLQIESPSSR